MSAYVATSLLTLACAGWWLLLAQAFRARQHPTSAALAWVAIVFAIWTTLSLLHVQASTAAQLSLLQRGTLFLALASPAAWWVLALRVARPRWLRRWHLVVLPTPALLGAVAHAAWPVGGPLVASPESQVIDGSLASAWQLGSVLASVVMAYAALLLLAAMATMVLVGERSRAIERRAAYALVVAMAVPPATIIVQFAGLSPLPGHELTGLALGPVALMLYGVNARSLAFGDGRVAYEAIFRAIAEPALIVRSDSTVLDANPAACQLLHGGESMSGLPLAGLAPQLEAARRRQRRSNDRTTLTGDLAGIEVSISHLRSGAPNGATTVLIMRDLRDRLEREQALHEAVERDPLTGIANRLGFESALQRALDSRGDDAVGLVYLDLDGFKPINDAHGHEAGDAVLVEVAQRLQHLLRAGDLAGRLGGDEFGLLLHRTTPSQLSAASERVRAALHEPIRFGDVTVRVGASLGLASAPRDGTDVSVLLRHADQRMYRQKGPRAAHRDLPTSPPDSERTSASA